MTRETSFKCFIFSGLCIQFLGSLDILVTSIRICTYDVIKCSKNKQELGHNQRRCWKKNTNCLSIPEFNVYAFSLQFRREERNHIQRKGKWGMENGNVGGLECSVRASELWGLEISKKNIRYSREERSDFSFLSLCDSTRKFEERLLRGYKKWEDSRIPTKKWLKSLTQRLCLSVPPFSLVLFYLLIKENWSPFWYSLRVWTVQTEEQKEWKEGCERDKTA